MTTKGKFRVILVIKNSKNDVPISFKVDGERFPTSSKTVKFCSNSKYKIIIGIKPSIEFHHFNIAGNDLPLCSSSPNSGEYVAEWNTTGIEPTKQATRQEIVITLQGPCGTLTKKLQSKFYAIDNGHVDWGSKLEALNWVCTNDEQGNISVVEEDFM